MAEVAAALRLLVGAALLNLALTFHNVWPTLWVRPVAELSLDLCAGLLLLALYRGRAERPLGAAARALLTTLLWLLVVGRYAQVSAPALFGRGINLYWDLPHLPAVAEMTLAALPPPRRLALLAGVGAAILLLWWLLWRLVGVIGDALRRRGGRRAALLLCAAALLSYAAGRASPRLASEHWFSISVAGMYFEQLGFALRAARGPDPSALGPPPRAVDATLDGRAGVDVQLIFLESLGAVVRDRGVFAGQLEPAYRTLERAASGRHAATAWLRSPTFGGASWLAHSTLLSGTWIDSQEAYRTLLVSDRATLVTRFNEAGYDAVALMPGLKKAWPEGAFYGFDRVVDAAAVDYPGPDFGWWAIPDQYSLDWLDRHWLSAPDRAPLLSFFPTVMSHSPFKPVAPYLPDWEQLRRPQPYSDQQHRLALAQGERDGDDDAYLRAQRYNLAVLAGHLRRQRERGARPALVIALGDHQPPAFITGPRASREIPVHVFSPDARRLQPFLDAGFYRGVRPPAAAADAADLVDLYALLLRAAAG